MEKDDDRALASLRVVTHAGRLGADGTELTLENAGQWLVLSRSSAHFFDLDTRTVNRVPGDGAFAMVTDEGRPIRTIESCRVGEAGYWTMEPFVHERDLDFRWHQSTEIQRIVQVLGLERSP